GDPERRARYLGARQAFIAAQAALQLPPSVQQDEDQGRHLLLERTTVYRAAKRIFDQTVEEIRAAHDPVDFLQAPLLAATILEAAAHCGPGHALVYLGATPWGALRWRLALPGASRSWRQNSSRWIFLI